MNKIFTIFFSLTFLVGINSYAQQISIKISDAPKKAILLKLQGEKTYLIDSVESNEKGEYKITTGNNKLHTGFYRISFGKNKSLNFIYDGKDIKIITDANNIFDHLNVIKSESNRLYYQFLRLNNAYKTKSELLRLILAQYPENDIYYVTTKEKLHQLQNEYLFFIKQTSQSSSKSFIARYISSAQLPIINSNISFENQLGYLKSHALDNVDFGDDDLIYSDVFTNKSIEYLTYYRNPQLPKSLLEKEFIKAVDTLLNKAKVNEIVYQQIVEYLIDGFRKYGFEKPLDYIVDNYVIKDNLCLSQELESSLNRRINQARDFKIGKTVPNIITINNSGNRTELNKINGKRILIIFYASWCPHCKDIVPKINQLYKNQKEKNTEVLAISIDTSKTDWLNFVKTNNLNWINASDLKGWYGKAANDYYLFATPTMFLVNEVKNVIAKPSTIEELKKWF